MHRPARCRPDQSPVPEPAGAPVPPASVPGPPPGEMHPAGFLGMAEALALLGAGRNGNLDR